MDVRTRKAKPCLNGTVAPYKQENLVLEVLFRECLSGKH
jgi:hypothetical protein